MTTPAGPATAAFSDAGVVGFVFGEMWQRGVLTPRDRRWITLSCVGAMDAHAPIESHVWAALNSGDVTPEELDEFVLHFATQVGWPKGSKMLQEEILALERLAKKRGDTMAPIDFEPWADPADDAPRRQRAETAYQSVFGVTPPPARTAFQGRAWLDYLYGEIWPREKYLTRRDRRVISICCTGAVAADDDVADHVRAALRLGELSYEELQELVVHYAVYVGWPLGRKLDNIVIKAADELGVGTPSV